MEFKKYYDMTKEEQAEFWNMVADWLTNPEEERVPKTKTELYEAYSIPESTFYWHLQNEDFMRKMVKLSLTKAKKSIPKILRILEKNCEEGKEKSLEMFMKYVGEVTEKIDHTTKGEKIGSVSLTDEQQLRLAQETIQTITTTKTSDYEHRTDGNSTEQGTSDTVLPNV